LEDPVEINGVAHVVFRAKRFEECISFYDRLMPELGLECVHRDEGFVYYVGGRTALAIRPVLPGWTDHPHVEGAPGLDHLCWRVRSREHVDAIYSLLQDMGAEMVRPPQEGPWAPGYYSLSFLDPEGIRLEVNHVPGKGVFAEDASFSWDPEYPLAGRPDLAT
jgi:catechol 2,3-dioxygenase-like lactoylglutathione lyase family enzyme